MAAWLAQGSLIKVLTGLACKTKALNTLPLLQYREKTEARHNGCMTLYSNAWLFKYCLVPYIESRALDCVTFCDHLTWLFELYLEFVHRCDLHILHCSLTLFYGQLKPWFGQTVKCIIFMNPVIKVIFPAPVPISLSLTAMTNQPCALGEKRLPISKHYKMQTQLRMQLWLPLLKKKGEGLSFL